MSDLVLIGGLAERHRDHVRDFCLGTGVPVYAEPLSGLREDDALRGLLIHNERMVGRGGFKRVIRIGNVPTLRFWRDLDESRRDVEVHHFSDLPFPGLSRGEVRGIGELRAASGDRDEAFLARDRDMSLRFAQILEEEPQSELSIIRTLSKQIPVDARVFIGNSLPIREWDLAATREARRFTIEANRGANGIDGQLSTFFGWCAPDAKNWCIVGDLTAIYDFNAPWVVPQLDASFKIVIINNGGGRIFSRVPSLKKLDGAVRERLIENAHDLNFGAWATSWNISDHVIELRPDAAASKRAWERYDHLWL
jgi:2-succinyl-5-enolpyruvyl-6-hydroxy-3-cyclohexene-1-carboxylate synthase